MPWQNEMSSFQNTFQILNNTYENQVWWVVDPVLNIIDPMFAQIRSPEEGNVDAKKSKRHIPVDMEINVSIQP